MHAYEVDKPKLSVDKFLLKVQNFNVPEKYFVCHFLAYGIFIFVQKKISVKENS